MISHQTSGNPLSRWLDRHPGFPLRFLVVAGVLALSAGLSYVVSPTQGLAVIGLVAGIGATLVLLRVPGLGLLAIVPAALLVPLTIGTGTESSINAPMMILLMMTGLMVLDRIVIRHKFDLPRSRPLLPLLALVVVSLIALAVGQLPWFPLTQPAPILAQIGGFAIILLSALAFLVTAMQVDDIRWLKWLTWTFLFFGAIFVVGQMAPQLKRTMFHTYQYGSTSSQFWIWMVALSLGQALFNRHLHPAVRIALAGFGFFTVVSAYFVVSGWKSGWVPALVTLFTLFVLRSWRFGLLGIVAGIAVAPQAASKLISSDQYSYSTRAEAWQLITQIVKVNPILGLGPANYYWYTPLIQISGYYGIKFSSHNQYIDIFAQIGVLGLAAFAWFAWEIGRLGWRLRTLVPEGFAKAYVYSVLAGLVGLLTAGMFGDWIFPFVYNIGFVGFRASIFGWMLLGSLVALERLYAQENESRR